MLSAGQIALICVAVVVVIIVAVFGTMYATCKFPLLKGLWRGTDKFLADSQLSLFHLYLNPVRGNSSVNGALIMHKTDGQVISGQKVVIRKMPTYIPGLLDADIEVEYESNAVMPTNLHIKADLDKGEMKLTANGLVYADLRRST